MYSNDNVTIGSATGWETYKLDTPYNWDGSSSLIVAVSRVSNGWTNTLRYAYTTTSEKTVWYRQDDSSSEYADITDTTGGNRSSYRPNIRLAILESSEPAATISNTSCDPQVAGAKVSASVDTSKTFSGKSVDATRVADMTYQWYYRVNDGEATPVTGATSPSVDFTVPDVDACSTISLYCTATYKFDGEEKTATSKSLKFMVISAIPAATPQPTVDPSEPVVLQNGNPITLTATSGLAEGQAGVGSLVYQWYESDSADGEFSAIGGATDAAYTVSPEGLTKDTYFKVEVTNTFENIKVATGSAVVKVVVKESEYKIIGTDTYSSSSYPFRNSYSNGLCEMLYTADELKAAGCTAGLIKELAFKVSDSVTGGLASDSIKIYMGATSATTMS